MRLLCLHGKYQCASKLKRILGQISGHELLLLNAPHLCLGPPPVKLKGVKLKAEASGEWRTWWEDGDESESGAELDSALSVVRSAVKDHPDVQGVIGFSQGGALAALLCTELAGEVIGWKPQYAALYSAYACELASALPFLSSGFDPTIRSMHIYGETDMVILPSKSLALCEAMVGKSRVHRGGHGTALRQFNKEVQTFLGDESA